MSIDALALLKGRDLPLPSGLLLKTLDDGVLVVTHQRFGGDLEELGSALRHLLGDALDRHDDARGVFVIPDVAEPRARTYDCVVDEIGEAGEWAPIVAAGHVPASMASAPDGGLANMMGQVMGALGGDTLSEMMQALTTGDTAALAAMQDKVVAALGGQEKVEALGKQMLGAAQNEAPAAAAAMQARLAAGGMPDLSGLGIDPKKLAELAQGLNKKPKGD
jgi:hypothetical protein